MARQDSSLSGGWSSGHRHEIVGADAGVTQPLCQERGRIVRTHRCYKATFRSQCSDARRDVRGTARFRDFLLDADDGDRGFRRYPVHGATEVDVEHGVTDHQDSAAAGLREEALGLVFPYQWRVWEHDIVLRPIYIPGNLPRRTARRRKAAKNIGPAVCFDTSSSSRTRVARN
jgi:hypothetical protein